MRTRIFLTATVAVLLAIAGVTLASAAGDSSGDDGRQVLKLRAVVEQEAFVNVPPDATTVGLGAVITFSDTLYDRSSGDRVGTDGGVCTVVSVSPPANPTEGDVHCVVTLSLTGGQITGQVLLTIPFAEGELPPPFEVAITGGTGKYEGAEGHVTVEETSPTESNLTVHLSD